MNKIIKSIGVVIAGNLFTLIAGVATGFLLPKLFTVSDYGYYKTYTLYTTYLGLFSLGIIDGIVLKYGNFDYNHLDRKLFRTYFSWYLSIHILISILIGIISFIFLKNENQIIFIFLAIELIGTNCIGYFQQISQITRRFNELSLRKIIQSALTLILLIPLFFIYKKTGEPVSYIVYIVLSLLIAYILLLWYLITYKEIVFGKRIKMWALKGEIVELIKLGVPLLVANLCSTLILTVDRQFVNLLFDNSDYAIYAFAYTMLTLVTVMVSAVSTVLYPNLKRATSGTLDGIYANLIAIMLIVSFGAIVAYFPLVVFINWFLPNYASSLPIFRIIFPGVALSAPITTIMHNYYKIYGENLRFFIKGIIIIFLSILANIVAYMLFHTMTSISWASIITLFVWFFIVDKYLSNKVLNYSLMKSLIYIVIVMTSFYAITCIKNMIVGGTLYLVIYVFVTWVFYKKVIGICITKFKKS